MPLANVFTLLPSHNPHKTSRTSIITLSGSVLQAACNEIKSKQEGQGNTMEKFLRALAGDQLQVIEVTETRSPKRQQLIDEIYKLHTELEQKLNNEEKELLERLLDANADEKTLYAEDKFIRGYRLGALMTMEVFAGQDKFFYEGGAA